jgi:hypothetical protein
MAEASVMEQLAPAIKAEKEKEAASKAQRKLRNGVLVG